MLSQEVFHDKTSARTFAIEQIQKCEKVRIFYPTHTTTMGSPEGEVSETFAYGVGVKYGSGVRVPHTIREILFLTRACDVCREVVCFKCFEEQSLLEDFAPTLRKLRGIQFWEQEGTYYVRMFTHLRNSREVFDHQNLIRGDIVAQKPHFVTLIGREDDREFHKLIQRDLESLSGLYLEDTND